MNLTDISVIRSLMGGAGTGFKKGLGQNFLTDPSVPEDMVRGAGICGDDLVIEIGPGIGVLTQAAAEKAGKVVSVEIDKDLIICTFDGITDDEIEPAVQ